MMRFAHLLLPMMFIALVPLGAHGACTYGPEQCRPGYVWREAFPGDKTCVTPDERARAASDNKQAAARKVPNGRWGPDTCAPGFVWREANANDHVCVSGAERNLVAADNAQAANRRDTACVVATQQLPPPHIDPTGLSSGPVILSLNFIATKKGDIPFSTVWSAALRRQGETLSLEVVSPDGSQSIAFNGNDAASQLQLTAQFPDAGHRLLLKGRESGQPAKGSGTAELVDEKGRILSTGSFNLEADPASTKRPVNYARATMTQAQWNQINQWASQMVHAIHF